MNAIRDKIRAGYPGLFLLTHEEGRAEAMLLTWPTRSTTACTPGA